MSNRLSSQFELIALLTCLVSLVGLSLDIMLPAFGDIAQDFAIQDSNQTQYIVILFIFGMVFGELVFGPLADAIGRKKIILIGLLIYSLGALIAILSQSLEVLLLGRIIQGIGVSGPKIGTRALIRDLFEGAAMARIMSIIFGVLILVPMVAPLFGQLIIISFHWRVIFACFVGLNIVLGLWFAWRQTETLPPKNRIPIAMKTLATNAVLILKHRHAVAYMLCAGFLFGAQLCYIALAHSIFIDLYQVGDLFPAYFAIIALGAGVGFIVNIKLVKYFSLHKIVKVALLALISLSVVSLVLSLSNDNSLPFTAFIIYFCLVFLNMGLIFGNIGALGMQYMGRVAGLASSLFASISSLMAVLASSLFGGFYNDTTLPLILIFLLAAIASLYLVHWAQKTKVEPV